jgi:excisionase family DNA binding protein
MATIPDAWPVLLTDDQAAAYLGISTKTLARLRAQKELAPRQLRGCVRYHRSDLDEYAESLPEVKPA